MLYQIRGAWAIARKDIALWVRSPVALVATIVPALMLLLVLGLAAASATTQPVAVVNLDGGRAARVMEQTALGFAGFRARVMSARQADRAFSRLDVSAVLTIPAGFSAGLAAGGYPPHQGRVTPVLGFKVRNFNQDSTGDLHRDVATVVGRFLVSGTAGPDPVRITVDEHDTHPHDADFMAYMLVAVLGMLIVQAGFVNAGLAATREWETGAVKELLLSPAWPLTVIVGKVLAGVIAAVFVAAVVALVAVPAGLLPGFTPAGAGLALAAVTLLAVFGAGFGVALAARLRASVKLMPVAIIMSFYLFFLAGGMVPLAYLPAWLRVVARVIPNTYVVHILRGAFLYQSAAGAGKDLLALAVAAAVGLAVGVPVLRRGLGQ